MTKKYRSCSDSKTTRVISPLVLPYSKMISISYDKESKRFIINSDIENSCFIVKYAAKSAHLFVKVEDGVFLGYVPEEDAHKMRELFVEAHHTTEKLNISDVSAANYDNERGALIITLKENRDKWVEIDNLFFKPTDNKLTKVGHMSYGAAQYFIKKLTKKQ